MKSTVENILEAIFKSNVELTINSATINVQTDINGDCDTHRFYEAKVPCLPKGKLICRGPTLLGTLRGAYHTLIQDGIIKREDHDEMV